MKYTLTPIAFAVGSSALAIRQSQQCVQLQASGGASGTLGQLSDGQNRIGGDHTAACYCLDNDGGFTDSSGRGCILTPPTTQFQCDVGASPTNGFAVKGGSVTYNGNSRFYACPVNDKGEYNVYTKPAPGQDKCVVITLGAGQSCSGGNRPGTSPSKSAQGYPSETQPPMETQPAQPPKESQPAQPPKESQPAQPPKETQPGYSVPSKPAQPPKETQPSAPSQPGNSCPTDLNGEYQYPHLIVPVSSSQPSEAPGTSYNGKANGDVCSLFNFDIPKSYSGHTCSLVFLFPEQKDLETSSFTISGSGDLEFSQCENVASQKTSWSSKGSCKTVKTVEDVGPGNSYTIVSDSCAAGETITYQMCATGGLSLEYFQDYNPSPIGAYVREC